MTDSACKICQGTRIQELFTANGLPVAQCPDCKVLQVAQDIPSEVLARIYDENYGSHSKYRFRNKETFELKRRLNWLLQSGVKEGQKILEVGCSTGEFLSVCSTRFDAYGQDLSASAIETAAKRFPSLQGKLFSGPIEDFSSGTHQFDAIVMYDVIEHLKNPLEALWKILVLLKDDGHLVMSTPNSLALVSRIMRSKWAFMTPPEHLFFFNRPSLQYLFDRNGVVMEKWVSKGKWTTLGFVLYKLQRVFPEVLSVKAVAQFGSWSISRLPVFIPTGDMQYVSGVKKKGRSDNAA
jgi:2-polyprenyl-3-methyl-5-hydroxy-6-metoxy-1,4-benzoquinol methylase